MQIEVPPLHDRMNDIPLLVKHFIEKYRDVQKDQKIELSPDVWKALYNHNWPGNVRELENIMERAVVLNSGERVELADLPEGFSSSREDLDVESFIPPDAPLQQTLEDIEEKLIRRALAQCQNVQAHAATKLGIKKNLIQHKMKKYGIVL